MDPITGALAGGLLGNAGGSAAGFFMDKALMKYQHKLGREARKTAYQDTRHSMEAAGINPILSAWKGPAPMGAGGIAQISNPGLAAASSVQSLASAYESSEKTKSKSRPGSGIAESLIDAQRELTYQQSLTEIQKQRESDARRMLLYQEGGHMNARTNQVMAQTRHLLLDQPRAQNEARYHSGLGKYAPELRGGASLIGDTIGLGNKAGGAAKGARSMLELYDDMRHRRRGWR